MAREAYTLVVEPLVLKEVILEADIAQEKFAKRIGDVLGRKVSKTTVNLMVNNGYIPKTMGDFKGAVEKVIASDSRAMAWLLARNLTVTDIWPPLGKKLRNAQPSGQAKRTSLAQHHKNPALGKGNPEVITITWEVEMVSQEAMRHFKLFRNPFIDDVQKDADIYMSEEHRYIEAAMIDAARHGGFLAVIGEVGSGKSIMRRKVIEQLKRDGDVLVIYPQMIDKGRLTAASICDAIIQDVSSEKCKIKLEDKTRQVQRLLLDRAKSGYRACLIIEEAHDLNVQTLKYLKRFYELEDGYRKLLGIVLIGQTELRDVLDERQNVDMREVIRRVQVAEIKGLNGHLEDYLTLKFKRIGRPVEEVFTPDAFDALSQRLTSTNRDGKGKTSHAYPLLVNNYTARALNMAHEMGEARITADVVMAL